VTARALLLSSVVTGDIGFYMQMGSVYSVYLLFALCFTRSSSLSHLACKSCKCISVDRTYNWGLMLGSGVFRGCDTSAG
jgi:hypothetical protein